MFISGWYSPERVAWKTPSRHPNAGPGRLWSLARGSTASERSGASIRPSTVRPGGGVEFWNSAVASVEAGADTVGGVLVVVLVVEQLVPSAAPSVEAGQEVDGTVGLVLVWSGVGISSLGCGCLSLRLDGSMAITASGCSWICWGPSQLDPILVSVSWFWGWVCFWGWWA